MMNMSPENKERVFKILKLLEYYGWAVIEVYGEGGANYINTAITPKDRCESAFETIDSVDESTVYVQHVNLGRSWVTLITSNDEDILSDHGIKLESVFEEDKMNNNSTLEEQTPVLTDNQQYVISTLEHRGDYFTARCAKDAWVKGEAYYLDSRNGAGKGLVRAFNKANDEATGDRK